MAEVFVKRVDFDEENNNKKAPPIDTTFINGVDQSDVEKLTEEEKVETCTTKFCQILDKFGIKSALSHIGLLLSLGLFCYGGGWVREESLPTFLLVYFNERKLAAIFSLNKHFLLLKKAISTFLRS